MTVILLLLDKLAQQQENLFSELIISCFPHWVLIQDLTLKIIFSHELISDKFLLMTTDNFRIKISWYTENSDRILWIDNFKKLGCIEFSDDNFFYFYFAAIVIIIFIDASIIIIIFIDASLCDFIKTRLVALVGVTNVTWRLWNKAFFDPWKVA